MKKQDTFNIVVAGLGGQGVLKASDILGDAVLLAGYDIKKSEVHGMSQRGGSVHSDVRFGADVRSPMVPEGEADVLLLLEATQLEPNKHYLGEDGVLIGPDTVLPEGRDIAEVEREGGTPLTRQNLNVALLGALSTHLDIEEGVWRQAIRQNLPERAHEQNLQVFTYGRDAAAKR